MNTKCPELREFDDLPDDPEATKERIIMFFSSMALGILLGIVGIMGYYALIGKPCSATPYCTIHHVK